MLPKSETKHDDIMICIMDKLQRYVPVVSEEVLTDIPEIGEKTGHADWFHHTLFGGDMLAAKRARGSQYIRSNSTRGISRSWGKHTFFILGTHNYYTIMLSISYSYCPLRQNLWQ